MRNFYRIHAPPVRDSTLKAGKPRDLDGLISEANEAQLNYFARYAYRLGFRNIWQTLLPLPADETGYDVKERRHPNLVTYEWEAGVGKERGAGHPKGNLTKNAAHFSRLKIWKHRTKVMAEESPTSSSAKRYTERFLIHGNRHPRVSQSVQGSFLDNQFIHEDDASLERQLGSTTGTANHPFDSDGAGSDVEGEINWPASKLWEHDTDD